MGEENLNNYSPAFRAAADMFREEPFPMDWIARLNALREKVPQHEMNDFDWFYKGFLERAPKEFFGITDKK